MRRVRPGSGAWGQRLGVRAGPCWPRPRRSRAEPGIAAGFAEVSEDRGDDVGVEIEGDDLHVAAAARTTQGIDLEDALQGLRPAPAQGQELWPGRQVVTRGALLGEGARESKPALRQAARRRTE